MEWLLLIIFVPMTLALALQLPVLWLTRTRLGFLRWMLPVPAALPMGMAVACWLEGGWFWELGVAVCLGAAASWLAGWGLAWGIFRLWKKKRAGGE